MHQHRLLCLLPVIVCCSAILSACAVPDPSAIQQTQDATLTSTAQVAASTQGAATTAVATGPTQLAGEGPWPVSFSADDGAKLSGMLYGQGAAAVVLAPMYPGGQEGWASFGQAAAAQGYRALAFDFRGYGGSGGAADATQAPADLKAAVAFLKDNGATQVVIIGAGLGGMAAIQVTPQDSAIKGLVVISSARQFEGLEIADTDLSALTVPSLWLAARNDMTQQVEEMNGLAGGQKAMWIYEGSSVQGTYILEGADGPDMQRRLLEFIASAVAA